MKLLRSRINQLFFSVDKAKSIFRLSKTPAQILIRWSVQHGFITIPKTSQPSRLATNADVFNWSIPDEDMKVLVSQI